jgi:hypothetical protein
MEDYFDIERDGTEILNEHSIKSANRHLFKAWQAYQDVWFISKNKRLRLIKRLALENVMELRGNLIHGNWVCLTKSENKRKVVGDYLNEVMDNITSVTKLKPKQR